MPTYEYECINCGHHFEKFQKMSDKPIAACPKCHKSIRRLIGTGSGIIFKGPGFYATDYRKSKPSEGAEERKGQAVARQEKQPQDKQPSDNKPQDKKSQDKQSHQKEAPGAKDTKS